ncbi:MAG: phage holin family protein [Ilumatobacteraceae bacterium]
MSAHVVRPAADRPSFARIVWRGIVVTAFTAFALWILAAILPGFSIDSFWEVVLAGFVVGVGNAVVWPALAFLVVPLSVLTLGLGAIILNALFVFVLLDLLPGVDIDGFWPALWIVIGLVIVSTLVSALLAVDDNSWFDQRIARQARRRTGNRGVTDVPGVVFIQLDGVAHAVFRRALRSGDVPTLHRWIKEGSHVLVEWETGWSSQTGVSQCGILHGSTVDMPAFRWIDKATGEVVVSNHPKSAALIEKAHSDGNGLLAHDGSSYGNLFSGDAERAVLTMSGAGERKEGRTGAGYFGYFSRPGQTTRTLIAAITEIGRERLAATRQRRRGVEPRVERGWVYALLRTFTTVITRDVSVQGVINDMLEGRATIYVDMLGYDEVAHHSGPERVDALAVLRDLDRHIDRIERTASSTPRPYEIVVLSDHGQTQGATFAQRTGQTLAAFVAELCGSAASGDTDAEAGNTESSAWLRHARHQDESKTTAPSDVPVVLGSGSLGLITIPGEPHRLNREDIDARYPRLISGLAAHPEIGFVLVRQASGSSIVLGNHGSLDLATGEVSGEDPLVPFGARAREQVAEVDSYSTAADLMINSRYDPELEEVSAFEDQVSSHGGLGGPQTHPFLLYPATFTAPDEPIFTSPAMYRVLKSWLADVGHPSNVLVHEGSKPGIEPAAAVVPSGIVRSG